MRDSRRTWHDYLACSGIEWKHFWLYLIMHCNIQMTEFMPSCEELNFLPVKIFVTSFLTDLPPVPVGFGQEQENLPLFHPHLGEMWVKESNKTKGWKGNHLLALLGDVLEVIADHNKGVLALVSTSQTHCSQPSTPLALTADNVVLVILLWVHF